MIILIREDVQLWGDYMRGYCQYPRGSWLSSSPLACQWWVSQVPIRSSPPYNPCLTDDEWYRQKKAFWSGGNVIGGRSGNESDLVGIFEPCGKHRFYILLGISIMEWHNVGHCSLHPFFNKMHTSTGSFIHQRTSARFICILSQIYDKIIPKDRIENEKKTK